MNEYNVVIRYIVESETDEQAYDKVLGLLQDDANEAGILGISLQTLEAR